MGVTACEICPKMTFLAPVQFGNYSRSDPRETGFTQTYLGKVLLQSILVTLDFPAENVIKSI